MLPIIKYSTFLLASLMISQGQLIKRPAVPAEILQEARVEVGNLAQEVRKGNFLYSLDHMYPRWKATMSKRVGGDKALQARLESVPKQMIEKGITIIDFRVGIPVSAFEVKGALLKDAKTQAVTPVFSEYLVFVPTTTVFRAIDPNGGVVKRLKSEGYQVALRPKEAGGKWSFIDGANLKIADLRGLFPYLPEQEKALNLPTRSLEEMK